MSGRLLASLTAAFSLALFSTLASSQSQCSLTGEPDFSTDGVTKPASIVQEGFEYGLSQSPTATGFAWHKGSWTGTVAEGYSDNGSLQFRYSAGKNGMSEQRFSLGGAYPELWFRYWIKVPINWQHGSGNSNNKFFAIWMDDYERQGPTGVIQTRDRNGSSVVSSYVRTSNNRHLGEETGNLLIDISRDRGQWMEIVIHVKMASGLGVGDGIFSAYRRRDGEPSFENIFSYNDWDNYHVGGNRGFSHGYLMGWANASQTEDTEWLLDNFTVSEHSLLGGTSVAPVEPSAPKTAEVPKILKPNS